MCSRLLVKHSQSISPHLVGDNGSHTLLAGQLLLADKSCLSCYRMQHYYLLGLPYSLGPLPSVLMPTPR